MRSSMTCVFKVFVRILANFLQTKTVEAEQMLKKYVRNICRLHLLYGLSDGAFEEAMRPCERNVQDLDAIKRFIGDHTGWLID